MGAVDDRVLNRQSSLWDKVQEQFPVDLDLNARGADGATPQNPGPEAEDLRNVASPPHVQTGRLDGAPATAVTAPEPLLKRLVHTELSPQQVVLRDKVGFVAGIGNIAITAWWMGKWPQTFYLWYTAKSLLLYGLRFLIYRSKGQHYFLLELCYSVNVLLLTYLWVFPRSAWLYKAVFGLVAGPLTWSIVALRNSLVLHSLDQMTSLFMHASPALVVWALRWTREPSELAASVVPAEAAKFSHATFAELVGCTMTMYSVWAVLYYLKVFVISASKIREENYETLYSLMTKNRNGMVAKIVFSVPKPFQPVMYMLFHFLLSAAAAATSYFCWHSFYYHTAFILLMLLGAAWNGSSFYFQHFAFKYVKKTGLDKLQDKKAA
jgi:hypothetical protein